MRKRWISLLLVVCLLSTFVTTAMAAGRFADVKPGDYFAVPVEWAVENGITDGTGETTFSPEMNCTRAHILTFLWRASGSPEPSSPNSYFDVADNAYYCKAAQWAREVGIYDPAGVYFEPDTPCTRASTVEYFWHFSGSPWANRVPFSDVTADTTLDNAVSWAVSYGITNGTNGTTFTPSQVCTRGQIVTFLYRYFVEPLDNFQLICDLLAIEEEKQAQQVEPAPTPTPGMTLDPLPPEDYSRQADWYLSLTPAYMMSDERLIAEKNRIETLIQDWRARDIFITDSVYARQLDLWAEWRNRGFY